jgi:hypothetical protein
MKKTLKTTPLAASAQMIPSSDYPQAPRRLISANGMWVPAIGK